MATEDPVAMIAATLNHVRAVWSAIRADGEEAMIRVWLFKDAPEALRRLSTHGGDEDWLAWLPPGVVAPPWTDTGTRFGISRTEEHFLPDGTTVLIGAHA